MFYFNIQLLQKRKKYPILRRESPINTAVSEANMKQNIKKTKNLLSPPSTGSIVEGKVISKEKGTLIIDLGAFGTGIIYGKEFYEAKEDIKKLNIGDKILAKITELENEDGFRELSLKEVSKYLFWEKIKEKNEKNETIEVKISGANKGGLLVNMEGILAFLPVSQLSALHYPKVKDGDKQEILSQLQKLIGKTLKTKILHLSQKENKIILSERRK